MSHGHWTTLLERISQNIKVSRASVGFETIKSYFLNLKAEIDRVSLSNIVNYDETDLIDDPGKKESYCSKRIKNIPKTCRIPPRAQYR